MASTLSLAARPTKGSAPHVASPQRRAAFIIALVGIMVVAVSAIGNLVVADNLPAQATGTAWAFGVGVTGLGILKLAIAAALVGIIIRLWYRVDSVTTALTRIIGTVPAGERTSGTIETDAGTADVSTTAPDELPIHKMARLVWAPVLAMGAMALVVGLILGFVAAAQPAGSASFNQAWAWTQGTLFLGEGLLLSGISLLLGTILGGLRKGGAEVQQAVGASVETLRMPASAKAFIGLMAVGMMAAIVQFVFYAVLASQHAGDPATFAVWSAWLNPFREVALGMLLSGVVLALFTISKVLGFQFSRIRELLAQAA